MHELSIAMNLLDIARDEMKKHGVSKLKLLKVRRGALSNVVPDALAFAFETLTHEGEFAGAALQIAEDPLVLKCGGCAGEFTPEDPVVYATCPLCGYEFLHEIVKGRELYLEHMEAE